MKSGFSKKLAHTVKLMRVGALRQTMWPKSSEVKGHIKISKLLKQAQNRLIVLDMTQYINKIDGNHCTCHQKCMLNFEALLCILCHEEW